MSSEKKKDIVHDIMKLRKKLKKGGKTHDKDISLMSATKPELLKFRKKLVKLSGGMTRDEAINISDEQMKSIIVADPLEQHALDDRDELADKIRGLLNEIEHERPGMVGFYHNGGKQEKTKSKTIDCPKCGAHVLVKGGKVKGPKNPNRQKGASGSDWMKLVNKVAAMPDNKGKPRSEIMKMASKIRKANNKQ